MPDNDFPCCAPVAGAVPAPVCDLCHMPAVMGEDGRYRHAEAADAAFCGLVMRPPREADYG